MQNYTVLMMDLRASRSFPVPEREELQVSISKAIKVLNHLFQPGIKHEVDFSAGDEVQGLFIKPETAYLYLRWFKMLLYPIQVHAGLGIGEWNIRLVGQSTAAQDGPAYHHARKAVEAVKSESEYESLLYSGNPADACVNAAISLVEALVKGHNLYQNELMLAYELWYPLGQREALDTQALAEIGQLLGERRKKAHMEPAVGSSRSNRRLPFEKLTQQGFAVEAIDPALPADAFYITTGKQRGIAKEFADLLGISRQSADKNLSNARIPAARNGSIAVVGLLRQFYGKGEAL